MYLSHLKLYGWYKQYGKCSYIISGLWGCIYEYLQYVLLCFCVHHSTCFWYKRRGFAVINIDIISYFVVKNMI